MAEKPVKYEPHPVSPERKAELLAQGYQIIDAIYRPRTDPEPAEVQEVADEVPADEIVDEQPKRRGRPPKQK
jgi:hypothetical protein